MIDTIRVKFRTFPTTEQLREYWDTSSYVVAGSTLPRQRHIYNTQASDGIALKATYLPRDYNGDDALLLELSLPKAQFGINWPMIPDIRPAVEAADTAIRELPGLPPLKSIADAELSRLDACYNYQVGDDITAYMQALSRLEYPRRHTVRFTGTGVEYRTASGKTIFYDKLQEQIALGMPPAQWPPAGTLRHETSYHRNRDLRRALRLSADKDCTLSALTPDAILNVLRRDLLLLGIADCSFATRETALEELCTRHGHNIGMRPYGLLCILQTDQKKTIARKTRTQRHSITRLGRQVRAAGITLALSEAEPLPPLNIDWPCDQPPLPPRRTDLPNAESSTPWAEDEDDTPLE